MIPTQYLRLINSLCLHYVDQQSVEKIWIHFLLNRVGGFGKSFLGFWKKLITFLSPKYFFGAASTFFCWHETLFRATSTCFCQHQITFCATSNFLFRHKIVFRATPNFCFGHLLECYAMVIYFYCHVATKM